MLVFLFLLASGLWSHRRLRLIVALQDSLGITSLGGGTLFSCERLETSAIVFRSGVQLMQSVIGGDLVYSADGSSVDTVIVDGNILVEGG